MGRAQSAVVHRHQLLSFSVAGCSLADAEAPGSVLSSPRPPAALLHLSIPAPTRIQQGIDRLAIGAFPQPQPTPLNGRRSGTPTPTPSRPLAGQLQIRSSRYDSDSVVAEEEDTADRSIDRERCGSSGAGSGSGPGGGGTTRGSSRGPSTGCSASSASPSSRSSSSSSSSSPSSSSRTSCHGLNTISYLSRSPI